MICFKLSTGETLRSYCLRHGICYQRLYWRIVRNGITPDQAIEHDRKRGRPTTKTIDGLTIKEYSKKYGLSLGKVYRIHKITGEQTNENI